MSDQRQLAFVVLTLVLVGALWLAIVGVSAQERPPYGTPYALPTLRATPTAECSGLLRSRLVVRERGRVIVEDDDSLNVREGPGTSFDIIGEIEPGGVFVVLEGAACSTIYTWYRVQRGSLNGWIAEGSASAYFVEPYPPG
jgi:uncharacterized protein YgiM (DUF1202 family)